MADPELADVQLSERVIGAAIEVHRHLGPGLLESVYEKCLVYELEAMRLCVATQKVVPIRYKGVVLEEGLRLDLLVEDRLLVELKSVETVLPLHKAQVISYIKLMELQYGLLINFNVKMLRDGVSRLVNPAVSGSSVVSC